MQNWERELGNLYTQKDWQMAIQSHFRYSHCVNHWELLLKILYRTYLTPVRLAQIYPDSSPNCWRDCGGRGCILHILWSCKEVRTFWKEVFSLINKVTGEAIIPSPQLALLNIGMHLIPNKYRSLITHILIAAKLTITSKWKSKETPLLSEVINRVKTQYTYEKFFAIKSHNIPKFNISWESWVAQYPTN